MLLSEHAVTFCVHSCATHLANCVVGVPSHSFLQFPPAASAAGKAAKITNAHSGLIFSELGVSVSQALQDGPSVWGPIYSYSYQVLPPWPGGFPNLFPSGQPAL